MKNICACAFLLTLSFNVRATPDKIELQHFWASPGEKLALQQIQTHARDAGMEIESFENANYNRLRENISERLSVGYLPEVSQWIGGEDLSILAESKTLISLPFSLNGKPLSAILRPEVYESIQFNGKTVALPIGLRLQSSAVYNKNVLAKINQSKVPTEWKDFLDIAAKLDAIGVIPLSITDEPWVLREVFKAVLLSFGQRQVITDLYKNFDQSGLLKKQLLKTFEVLFELRRYADPEHKDRSWSDTVKMVVDGKAAAVFIGDYARSEIAFTQQNFECAGLPGLQNAAFSLDIFVLFNNKNIEWNNFYSNFVESVLSPESQSDYLHYKGGLPVTTGVDIETLNHCSRASLKRWNENPTQRFIASQHHNKSNIVIDGTLSKIWHNTNLTPQEAVDIFYRNLNPMPGM